MSSGSERMVDASARLDGGVCLGFYTVVEAHASLGAGCIVGHHAVIHANARVGARVRIDDFACVGKQPFKAARSATSGDGAQPGARIGDGCILGTGSVVYAGAVLAENVLVADGASVREDVAVGSGTIIGRGVTIENHVRVGARCKIESGAYITAYSVIGDDCFIAPGVVTSNDNFAGRSKERFGAYKGVAVRTGGRIGAGAVVLPGRTVEADGFAAAGSVVTRDVPAAAIVAGNPARPLRDVPAPQAPRNQEQSV